MAAMRQHIPQRVVRWQARFCVSGLASLIALALLVGVPSLARAGSAIVVDVASGAVLHAHEPLQRRYPASLTKLMTVYVVFREIEAGRLSRESPVRLSERAKAQPFNMMDWPAGTETTMDEAIRILMVKSANDVAVAVAETVSGDVEAFAAEMNRAAAELGMDGSHFVNPNGIHDPRHYSTARDLAILARALLREYPQHADYFALEEIEIGGRTMPNYNPLLGSFAGANGMKTGYVCESGYSMVASATRDGRTLVAVILGALDEAQRGRIAAALLEKGFDEDGGGAMLSGLAPARNAGEPMDMRPYACGGRQVPAEVASFGLGETRPLLRPDPR